MSALIQNEASVHYEVLGRGKPIIFLHSWIGSWRYWVPSMQFTSNRHRTYALDFWGFGASTKLPSRYTLECQVSLLHDFILQMGIDHFTLVGHGLGSIIAIYYAADHSESVERLMVISFPMGNQNANPELTSLHPSEAAEWLFGSLNSSESTGVSLLEECQFLRCGSKEKMTRLSVPQLMSN
jgi:pimeloyl-ACP methyl ester carboxylesterase